MIILILALLVICFLSLTRLSFSFIPQLTIRTLHWWSHPMRNSLKAYLSKEIPNSDLMIHYHIGGGLMGETDLRLRGDGAYDLWTTATKGRKRKSYSGQARTSQVEQVVQDILAVKLWQVRHLYASPALDDAPAMISVEVGEQKNQVLLWVSEIRESPPFFSVREQLEALIDDLSRGRGQRDEVVQNGQGTNSLESKSEVGRRCAEGENSTFWHPSFADSEPRAVSQGSDLRL